MNENKPGKGDGLRGRDRQQGGLQDSDEGLELPEGLKRDRKGPLNKTTGRAPPKD
jgi:hypothetical protein